ncbi:MAG TPA: hypothetical protein DCS93_19430 [Microscillaceae bacterium]|nr:hypothetical protein [Microscillaceae bacterium]
MTLRQLRERINTLGINPPDELRTIYYLEILERIKTQLAAIPENEEAEDGQRIDRQVIEQAFQNENLTDLLDTYARIFDNVIHGGLNAEIADAFAKDNTQNTAEKVITARMVETNYVEQFYTRYYPFLGTITRNIERNVIASMTRVARRISADLSDLNKVFGGGIQSLRLIETLDDILVKRGQQTLLLTFNTSDGDTKIVYKPYDIEMDALIVGDSVALGRADTHFFAGEDEKSFYELINEVLERSTRIISGRAHLMPTYKLLPRNYGSRRVSITDLTKAYGYVEFLSNEKTKENYQNPLGAFSGQTYDDYFISNEPEIAERFFTILGQTAPIAHFLSLTGANHQNLIVYNFLPYLVEPGSLFYNPLDKDDGVTRFYTLGLLEFTEKFFGIEKTSGSMPETYSRQVIETIRSKNRLWDASTNAPIFPQNFIDQIATGIDTVTKTFRNIIFGDWLSRARRATTRYTIYSTRDYTSDYQSILNDKSIISATNSDAFNAWAYARTQQRFEEWSNQLTTENPDDTYGLRFLGVLPEYTYQDYANGDLPVFYHKLNTRQVVNSQGIVLTLPSQTINYIGENNVRKTLNIIRSVVDGLTNTNRSQSQDFFLSQPFESVLNTLTGVINADQQIRSLQDIARQALGMPSAQIAARARTLQSYQLRGTSTPGDTSFENLRAALMKYQSTDIANERARVNQLTPMLRLAQQWITSNANAKDEDSNTKRTSIQELIALINGEIAKKEIDGYYFRKAKAFEHRLGLYLFNNTRVTTAATAALNKMAQVLGVTNEQGQIIDSAIALEVFGRETISDAGNVGKDIGRIREVLQNGNLREKMTAFFNAAHNFEGNGFGALIVNALKQGTSEINPAWTAAKEDLKRRGINQTGLARLQERKEQISHFSRFPSLATGRVIKQNTRALRELYTRRGDAIVRTREEEEEDRIPFRIPALDIRYTAEAFNYRFDQFNFPNERLVGNPNSSSSIFARLRQALESFNTSVANAAKSMFFQEMKVLAYEWIEANQQMNDAATNTKRASIKALQQELGRVYNGSVRMNADLNIPHIGNASLSTREIAHIQEVIPGFNPTTDQLPWEEGGTRFVTNPENAWIRRATRILGMPVISGYSGTADVTLSALAFLGLEHLSQDFRLALLGWLISSNDHSYHEIMAVSATMGLPYDPGSYYTIAPLTTQELRTQVCENRMFPDEQAYNFYRANFDDVFESLASGFTTSREVPSELRERLSSTGITAIQVLTTDIGYDLLNATLPSLDDFRQYSVVENLIRNPEGDFAHIIELLDQGRIGINDVIRVGRLLNYLLINNLRLLPPYLDTVYRGEFNLNPSALSITRFSGYTSTSISRQIANGFIQTRFDNLFRENNSITGFPTLRVIQSRTGRRIDYFSLTPDEEEVILLPGINLNITEDKRGISDNSDDVPVEVRPYTRITMEERLPE